MQPRVYKPVNWVSTFMAQCPTTDVRAGDFKDMGPDNNGDTYSPAEARRLNAASDACIRKAERENRDYVPGWANWLAVMLLGVVGIGLYDRHRARALDADQ